MPTVLACAPVDAVAAPDEHLVFTAELRLAKAVARGDRDACEDFARRLLPTARRVTHILIRDGTDAQDAAQVVLLELLRSAGTYGGKGRLEAWARRIATRTALRWIRSQRRRRERFDDCEETQLIASFPDMSAFAAEEALPRPLDHYLGALPEVQRRSLLLRHALGYTIPEIAELTAAPVPTVRSRILKAEQEIRRLVRRDRNIGVVRKASSR